MFIVPILLACLGAYFVIGVTFAAAFVWKGIAVVDPAARGSSFGFRLIVLPGCAAFWPLLARRWWLRLGPPIERSAHRVGRAPGRS